MLETVTSFSAELSHEHASLLEQLRELEEAMATLGAQLGEPIADRLQALRANLQRHFHFEEQGGYMRHVLDRAPHLHRTVEELLAEHHRLGQGLDELVELARAVPCGSLAPAMFRDRAQQWITLVSGHEARENRLVQEACNRDLGTDD